MAGRGEIKDYDGAVRCRESENTENPCGVRVHTHITYIFISLAVNANPIV